MGGSRVICAGIWVEADHGTSMRQVGLIIGKCKMRRISRLEILWLVTRGMVGAGAWIRFGGWIGA